MQIQTKDFSLSQTLECGQCFRWVRTADNAYVGTAFERSISIEQRGDTLFLSGCDDLERTDLEHYLGLDEPYEEYKRILSQDDTLRTAITFAPGIRIMKQPFWETLCSFIISQNNNIKRIMGIVERLCEGFGQAQCGCCRFPDAQSLSSLCADDLAPIRCGFRAKYIVDAAKLVSDGTVSEKALRELPLDEAREMLMKIKGVGPKVADCVLLFSLSRYDAFPQDVWIKRAMSELFPSGLPEYAKPIAGIAQQYIFHYARMSGIFSQKQ